MALILIIIIFIVIRMYLLTNFITMLVIPIQQALSPFQLPRSENTNTHAQLNSMLLMYLRKWRSIRDQTL